MGRRHPPLPGPRPGAVRRRRARRRRHRVGFEEKPKVPKSDLIPIGVYFLRPDAFDVIEHLAPSGRGEFEITDVLNHYIPERRLFTRVYEGTGPTPARSRRCSAPPSCGRGPTRPGRLARAGPAAGRRIVSSKRPAPWTAPDARLLVTGGAGFVGSCFVRDVLGRRDGARIVVLDKLTYAGNEANLRPVRADPEQAARLDLRPRRHRRPGRRRAARRGDRRGRQFRRRVACRPLDPRPRGLPADGRDRRPRAPRGLPGREARRPATSRFLQVSTDEVYGSVETGRSVEDGRARAAVAVRGGQGGRRAARPVATW